MGKNTIQFLVNDLLDIAESLGYQWLKSGENGDILYFGKNYGINIYSLKEFVDRANSICDAFLLFTGSARSNGFKQDNCGGPRDVLIRYFLNRWAPKHATVAVKSSRIIRLFEKTYVLSDERGRSGQRLMELTYLALSAVFKSRPALNQLDDPNTLKLLTDMALQEVEAQLDLGQLDEELAGRLVEVRMGLVPLKATQ